MARIIAPTRLRGAAQMPKKTIQPETVAEAYLTLLKDRGVDYLFGNAGTDFASIIEALSKSVAEGTSAPTAITVPHENLGVAMAHGYYLATGRPQAVMVHVNVGTANGICGVMNAARENVPILFTSGRTPLTEEGVRGGRSIFIHWGQEMFDQAGTVREMVKWDYELRNADQLESVVDRAISLAMTEPRGPAYLQLPREVLAADPGAFTYDSPTRRPAARPPAADPNAIDQAAEWIAAAQNAVIITASYGQDGSTVGALSTLTERFALPVIAYRPRYMCLPTDHPMHMGYEPAGAIKEADVIVVLDCDVPWIPNLHKTNPDAKIVHIGVDPLFRKYPVRGFRGDLTIAGSSLTAIIALTDALDARAKSASSAWTRSRMTTISWSANHNSPSPISISARRARFLPPARPAASAGAWAHRSASSSARPKSGFSPWSATAPICSATRPRRIMCLRPITCRW
jgi:acetolactate synthase-1/2/3 large subunit